MFTIIVIAVVALVIYVKFFEKSGKSRTTGATSKAVNTLKQDLAPVVEQVKTAGVNARTAYTDAQKAKELERIVSMLSDNPGLIEQATKAAAEKQLAELVDNQGE